MVVKLGEAKVEVQESFIFLDVNKITKQTAVQCANLDMVYS